MSTNMPQGNQEALVWLESIIAQWNLNFPAIGLTSGQVLSMQTDITAARNDFISVETVRIDSKTKTQEWYDSAAVMRSRASTYITAIKGTAQTSDDPTLVLSLAGLTPADPKTPALPPNQPAIQSTRLEADGSVTINFAATGPSGTAWQVSRQLPTETAFTFIGIADTRAKSYTDVTVPGGVSNAIYRVQGVRGSLIGPNSLPVTVQFGGTDGVQMTAAA